MKKNIRIMIGNKNLTNLPDILQNDFEKIKNNYYLSGLNELCDEYDVNSVFVPCYRKGDPSLTGWYLIYGLDKNKVYDSNIDIEKILNKEKSDPHNIYLDVAAKKIDTSLGPSTYFEIESFADSAELIRELDKKENINSRTKIDTTALFFRKMIYKNMVDYKLKASSRNFYNIALKNDFKLEKKRERNGRREDTGEYLNNTFHDFLKKMSGKNVNEVGIEEVWRDSDEMYRLTIPSTDVQFIENYMHDNPDILYHLTPIETNNNISTAELAYNGRFDVKIQYALLKHRYPNECKNTIEKMRKDKKELGYFGLRSDDYIKFANECKSIGLDSKEYAVCEAQFGVTGNELANDEKLMKIAYNIEESKNINKAMTNLAIKERDEHFYKEYNPKYNIDEKMNIKCDLNSISLNMKKDLEKISSNKYLNSLNSLCDRYGIYSIIVPYTDHPNGNLHGWYIVYGTDKDKIFNNNIDIEKIMDNDKMDPDSYNLDIVAKKIDLTKGPATYLITEEFVENVEFLQGMCDKYNCKMPDKINKSILYLMKTEYEKQNNLLLKPGNTIIFDKKNFSDYLDENQKLINKEKKTGINITTIEDLWSKSDIVYRRTIQAKYLDNFKRAIAKHPEIPIYFSPVESIILDVPEGGVGNSKEDNNVSMCDIAFQPIYAKTITYELMKVINPDYCLNTHSEMKKTAHNIKYFGLNDQDYVKFANECSKLDLTYNDIALCEAFYNDNQDLLCIAYRDEPRVNEAVQKAVRMAAQKVMDEHIYKENKTEKYYGSKMLEDYDCVTNVQSADFIEYKNEVKDEWLGDFDYDKE